MKKVILAVIFIAVATLSFAQNAKVTTASNYLKQNELVKAKTAIDAANEHVKTKDKPKTLMYKGKIYFSIAIDTTAETAPFRKDAIFVSSEAFQLAKKNADNRTDMQELQKYLGFFVYNKMWDDGVANYNAKEYLEASKHFAGCAEIKAVFGELDTTGYFYAANTAAAAEEHELAIKYFDKIKDTDYQQGGVFSSIASQYKAMGDTTKAIEAISQGRKAFPENQSLLIAEFNIYVEMGETEKAISNIDKAIEANPTNAAYLDVRGKLKQQLNDLEGAEADYLASLAVDPDQLDANYDLGALYVNESIKIVDELNNLPLNATKEYDAKKIELTKVYEKALPYLEKAYQKDPSNAEVQDILTKLYLKTNKMDKYKKLQDEIKGL